MTHFFSYILGLVLLSSPLFSVEITWYGHSSFKIVGTNGTVILIDPWLKNPINPLKKRILHNLQRVDFILITHGHGDAIGNTKEILQKFPCKVACGYTLAQQLKQYLDFPPQSFSSHLLTDSGGSIRLNDEVIVKAIKSQHSSEVIDKTGKLHYAGNALGFLMEFSDGTNIFHTGDTSLSLDYKLLSTMYDIDILMVCIGGHFTMGPKEASLATIMLKPNHVIPMKYGTFPSLTPSAYPFEKELDKHNFQGKYDELKINVPVKF
jgi:L-ascorbate metabolism protein UlaG (beta-lactamase superfamily)